nr:hypothetical protein [Tanacetum cinerariifolium]
MVVILEKNEHNTDFHLIVDFIEASPLRYALTFKPTIYVSHIRQFWSTARIKTTTERTQILATVDGVLRTVTESSLRRNLKLQDEEGISSLPDTKLFENLTLMGYNISHNQKFTFQKATLLLLSSALLPIGLIIIPVSHIRQFWSTARIKTTNEGTQILATVDGKARTIFESSIRRNLKLNDEEGISTLQMHSFLKTLD